MLIYTKYLRTISGLHPVTQCNLSNRKRQINIDGNVFWAYGSGLARKDANYLKKALRHCDATNLVQAISNSLDDAPPKTTQTLKAVLDPLIQSDNGTKQCGRCHKTYHQASNTTKSCIIKCVKPEETNIPDEYSDRPWDYCMLWFPRCGRLVNYGESYLPDGHDYDSGRSDCSVVGCDSDDIDICYTAKHTVDPSSVRYYSAWDESKKQEEGIDYSGQNENARTCKMIGCGKGTLKRKRLYLGFCLAGFILGFPG
ncbi:hypothetical protein FRC12_012850 [Ceratobasidium sp. 428]|nr:hypothetical protein FRC12_012850 [Ceratobasidium sp. 428]